MSRLRDCTTATSDVVRCCERPVTLCAPHANAAETEELEEVDGWTDGWLHAMIRRRALSRSVALPVALPVSMRPVGVTRCRRRGGSSRWSGACLLVGAAAAAAAAAAADADADGPSISCTCPRPRPRPRGGLAGCHPPVADSASLSLSLSLSSGLVARVSEQQSMPEPDLAPPSLHLPGRGA